MPKAKQMANRINKSEHPENPSNDGAGSNPVKTIHAVQTPFGVFQVALALVPGQPDPLAFSLNVFQEAVKAGAEDPLKATLQRLHEMALTGASEPLRASIELLKQMSAAGVLEPVEQLMLNSGFGPEEITRWLGGERGTLDSVAKRAWHAVLN
jgi:hypothetical protein